VTIAEIGGSGRGAGNGWDDAIAVTSAVASASALVTSGERLSGVKSSRDCVAIGKFGANPCNATLELEGSRYAVAPGAIGVLATEIIAFAGAICAGSCPDITVPIPTAVSAAATKLREVSKVDRLEPDDLYLFNHGHCPRTGSYGRRSLIFLSSFEHISYRAASYDDCLKNVKS
jgi:hypothetical protein